jgi:hypothetical protein
MNIAMHGKRIKVISWPDSGEETGRCLPSDDKHGELTLSATYHGDRDEFWIVQTNGGKEIGRHNARYVESIMWAD